MNSLAANRTGRAPARLIDVRRPRAVAAFVEDLNWPVPLPPADRKAPRPTEMWVPGLDGLWEGSTPTLQ